MKSMMNANYVRNGENYNFNFSTDLSYSDKLKFVNSVVNILVDDANYNHVIRDLIFNFYIIDIFSDIDTSEYINSSFFVDDVEELLEETNIIEIIVANMKDGLIEELNEAIDLNVEYRTGIRRNPINKAIANIISTIENKLEEIDLSSAMDMVKMFSGMTEELTPENIVNAYMNSDVHQNNVLDIKNSKKKKN